MGPPFEKEVADWTLVLTALLRLVVTARVSLLSTMNSSINFSPWSKRIRTTNHRRQSRESMNCFANSNASDTFDTAHIPKTSGLCFQPEENVCRGV